MHKRVFVSKESKPKEIFSEMLEILIPHLFFSPEENLKEFVSGCYDDVYCNEKGKLHKARGKERDELLKLKGETFRKAIMERYLRGYEVVSIVGAKRTFDRSTSMIAKKGRPRKKGHK